MSEKKEFYIIIKGEKVTVSEEVYRAYVRPIRAEQRRTKKSSLRTIRRNATVATKIE